MTHNRDPERLLRQIQEEEDESRKGKLKIYLGAAPGVGKTYKMLHDAYLRRMKNLDVLVGIAESHRRQEIDKMLSQFEILPPQTIQHRDKSYTEFDLDAALRRAPGLILVDEMAHTNVSGLRHEKRWQDIKELLDRGIDVYTTLNVQHIESLKDDVAHIIQAPVKETVPDFMLESAYAIELVDLPVEDLLKRLEEGKIYFPAQAHLAANHFFRKGNLIALRELALRVAAHCVDSAVLSYRKASGIQAIWPTVDKILVCVGSSSQSLRLIRIAKQLASNLQAEWMAVYIDTPDVFLTKNKRNRAIENLHLAEKLGAITHVLQGRDIVKELLQFARTSNVTQIMLSKDRSHPWRYIFRRRLADELIAQSGEIDVYIVGSQKNDEVKPLLFKQTKIGWHYYGVSLLAMCAVTALGSILEPFLSSDVIALLYLLSVMWIALLGRPGPAIISTIISVLTFDYFFIQPTYQLKMISIHSFVTLIGLFLTSLTISYWLLLKYREATIAREMQQQTRASYDFSQKLLRTRGKQEILSLGVEHIARSLEATVVILIPKEGKLTMQAAYPDAVAVSEKDCGVAQWVYDMAQPAGPGTDTLSSADGLYIPLHTSSQPAIGVLKIQNTDKKLFSPEQRRSLESFVNQLALALEVEHLQEELRKKQLKQEIDLAKNALLKTMSTQLNYPLKFILEGLGSSVLQNSAEMVNEELNKISLINNNILQIIEFEAHHIELKKTEVDLNDVLQNTIKQVRKTKHNGSIAIHSPSILPKLMLDVERIQEVLLNLLDNSMKYALAHSVIEIVVTEHDAYIQVSVENTGSAINYEDLSKIFHPFYRITSSEYPDSLGLGLTYCQINVEAHGGQIWAENLPEKRGVAFRFTLPK